MQVKAAEKTIWFKYLFPSSPFYISADEQQMEQVLINIVKNAIEAIKENGTITFEVNQLTGQLVVTDTGEGIAADIADQLFTPFSAPKKMDREWG